MGPAHDMVVNGQRPGLREHALNTPTNTHTYVRTPTCVMTRPPTPHHHHTHARARCPTFPEHESGARLGTSPAAACPCCRPPRGRTPSQTVTHARPSASRCSAPRWFCIRGQRACNHTHARVHTDTSTAHAHAHAQAPCESSCDAFASSKPRGSKKHAKKRRLGVPSHSHPPGA